MRDEGEDDAEFAVAVAREEERRRQGALLVLQECCRRTGAAVEELRRAERADLERGFGGIGRPEVAGASGGWPGRCAPWRRPPSTRWCCPRPSSPRPRRTAWRSARSRRRGAGGSDASQAESRPPARRARRVGAVRPGGGGPPGWGVRPALEGRDGALRDQAQDRRHHPLAPAAQPPARAGAQGPRLQPPPRGTLAPRRPLGHGLRHPCYRAIGCRLSVPSFVVRSEGEPRCAS